MNGTTYRYAVTPHNKGLGWVAVEYRNNKITWESSNYALPELAITRAYQRQNLIGLPNITPQIFHDIDEATPVYITLAEASKKFNVSINVLRRWSLRAAFPAYTKVGKTKCFSEYQLKNFIAKIRGE